jgi:hypothetical protein
MNNTVPEPIFVYIEGTCAVGKTTTMRKMQQLYKRNFNISDYVSVYENMNFTGDAVRYQNTINHLCTVDDSYFCTIDGCAGRPDLKYFLYGDAYAEVQRNVIINYYSHPDDYRIDDNKYMNVFVFDRNYSFCCYVYPLIFEYIYRYPDDYELDGGLNSKMLPYLDSIGKFVIGNYRNTRCIMVINKLTTTVTKMRERNFFDVVGRSDAEIQRYVNLQNIFFTYIYENFMNKAICRLIFVYDDCYSTLEQTILQYIADITLSA